MKKTTVTLLVLIAGLTSGLASSPVSASHHSPLYEATDRYRDAVVNFERHIIRSRLFDRHDVRLVDDLEDSTSRLRSAARHVVRSSDYEYRFASAMQQVNKLQSRVDQAIFGQSCYRPTSEIVRCWQSVTRAHADVINEANCLLNYDHVHLQNESYRVPDRVPYRISPQIISPVPILTSPIKPNAVRPIPVPVPNRRSVYYQRRSLDHHMADHHSAIQARVGAFLQRR